MKLNAKAKGFLDGGVGLVSEKNDDKKIWWKLKLGSEK